MTDGLTHAVVFLNGVANALGRLLEPIAFLPGWLSATLIAVATGAGMLVAFKYTSNQRAIRQARRTIRANLLAVKLFKESPLVGLRCQGRVLAGAFRLLPLAIAPVLVMLVPVCLLLGQLSLWYQARPLAVGEEAVVTLRLAGDADSAWPDVELESHAGVEDLSGPVRVLSRREVCWNVRPRSAGYHRFVFRIDGQPIEAELAAGEGFMRVSARRPTWDWSDALLNPREKPLGPGSPVRSVEIEYLPRPEWASGTDSWVIYWFVVSLAAGFCLRGVLKVNL